MKLSTLEAVLDATGNHNAVALLTDLQTGYQAVLGQPEADDAFHETIRSSAVDLLRHGLSKRVEHEDQSVFVQVFTPPLRMIIVGAVHIAQALAPMARTAGFAVVVVDPRAAFASKQRFENETLMVQWPHKALEQLIPDARTAVITLTHDPKIDDVALKAVLQSDAFYIGSLGSRRTHAKRLERLREMGFSDAMLDRIHAPVGLDLGAKTPAEIAVSVLAQVIANLRMQAN